MSVYGDLSKAQRALLTALFHRSGGMAVSIDTALQVDRKGRQTAGNLEARRFVQIERDRWGVPYRPRVWLAAAGVELMRSLDFRHAR